VYIPLKDIAGGIIDDEQIHNPDDKVFILLANTKSQTNQYLIKLKKRTKGQKNTRNGIKNPRRKRRSIADSTLKSLRMRGNKSPVPPVLTAPRGGVLNPKGIK
jgi:hypothetical protein